MRKNHPGLRDIGPRYIDVRIGDVTLKVRALSARDILNMMDRFDPVRRMLEGGTKEIEKNIAGPDAPRSLLVTVPEAVFWAMATCTGTTPERREEDERIASELPFGDQVAIINAIFQATFREGVGPFMKVLGQLKQVMAPILPVDEDTTPVDATPGSASRNVSPPPSPAALHVDLAPERLGRLHLAS
jgi:hypothetical protein